MCFPCLSYHTSVLQKVTIIGYWTKCTRNLSVLFFTTAGASAAISIDILIKIQKKKKKRGEPVSLEAINIIHLLSLSPWVYVFAIFCVAKRDTAIPLLGCRLKRGGGLKENVSAVVWIAALLSQSSWQTKYGYLVLGSPQTFSSKWTRWEGHSTKTTDSMYPLWWRPSFKEKLRLLENQYLPS